MLPPSPPAIAGTLTYLATVLPGLEAAAAGEILAKTADAAIHETPRGKVLFASHQPLDRLRTLRSVDNLYLFVARFTVGPHRAHLRDLEAAVARLDLTAAAAAALDEPARRRVSFVVNASRAGRHTYSRFEAAAAAARAVLARNPGWRLGTAAEHDLELRLDLLDEQALLSLRLTPPAFRWRGRGRLFAQAAVRPPVAHALVWLSEPGAGDRFLDPFCGSGTILAERAAYPARLLLGGDRAAKALAAARQNVPPAPGLAIVRWDARNLPLAAGSIDKVVSNLPFGQQILSPGEIDGLYRAFAGELQRVLAPGGHVVLLTDQVEALRTATEGASLQIERRFSVSLKGLHPQIVQLTRA